MDDNELKIGATEFKATCLELLDKLAARKIAKVIVTKRGRAVATVSPPPAREALGKSLFGRLKGRMAAPAGFDFTAPVLDKVLDASKGRLHR